MKIMTDGLWTLWTTRKQPRLDHTAHNPGDKQEVGHFSIVKVQTKLLKWVIFRLSNGYLFA